MAAKRRRLSATSADDANIDDSRAWSLAADARTSKRTHSDVGLNGDGQRLDQREPTSLDDFITRYAQGLFPADAAPAQPPELVYSPDTEEQSSEPDPSASTSISRFYRANGYLPAPHRDQSNRTIVVSPQQRQAVDRITKLARGFFKSYAALILLISGPDAVLLSIDAAVETNAEFGATMPAAKTVCAHSVLLPEGETMQVANLPGDWRFSRLPHFKKDHLQAYFGQPIRLRRESAPGEPARTECVGNLCVTFKDPQERMTPEQLDMLRTLGDMVAHELDDGADARQRHLDADRHDYVARFIAAVLTRPVVPVRERAPTAQECLERATRDLKAMLSANAVIVVDLRHDTNDSDRTSDAVAHGKQVVIMASDDPDDVMSSALRDDGAVDAVRAAVADFGRTGETCFNRQSPGRLDGLTASHMHASLVVPLSGPNGVPTLLFIALSTIPLHRFGPSDAAFVTAVGAVCLARIVHDAYQERADVRQIVSHQLRTPLHLVINQLELIRQHVAPKPAGPDVLEPLLDTARACAVGLREVLEDMLRFGSSGTSDVMQLQSGEHTIEEVNLSALTSGALRVRLRLDADRTTEVVAAAISRRSERLAASGDTAPAIDVSVDVEDNPNGWSARVDAVGLRCALLNVTLNALTFTTSGSVNVGLALSPDTDTSSAVFTVRDTGIGMDESFVSTRKLFLPFVKADPFSAGAGLGLSICEQLVERARGGLAVESVLGEGTTVTLTIPIDAVLSPAVSPALGSARQIMSRAPSVSPRIEHSSPSAPSPAVPHDTTPWDEQPLRVLVADDNSMARRILTTLLARKSVDWREAEDGLQALELYKLWRPHVIWTDISMPVMDGLQLASQVRSYEATHSLHPSRIIAVSASREHSAQSLGSLDDYIVKGGNVLPKLSAGLDALQARRPTDEPSSC